MSMNKRAMRPLLLLCAALLAAPAAFAQDLSLLMRHKSVASHPDGLTHTIEFAEKIYRRGDTVWIERVLPAGAVHADAHRTNDHRHLDVNTAARWITRGPDGAPTLRLVSAEDQVVVDVAKTDWDNVGFDGSWAAASHLLDPALLGRMKVVEQAAQASDRDRTTTYARQDANGRLTVVWSEALRVPLRVDADSARGSRETRIERLPLPAVMPWESIDGYQRKDYADYLD